MDNLYDYFIHYNPYTKYWNAVPRELAIHYLNGEVDETEVIKSKSSDDLIRYITKLDKDEQ